MAEEESPFERELSPEEIRAAAERLKKKFGGVDPLSPPPGSFGAAMSNALPGDSPAEAERKAIIEFIEKYIPSDRDEILRLAERKPFAFGNALMWNGIAGKHPELAEIVQQTRNGFNR